MREHRDYLHEYLNEDCGNEYTYLDGDEEEKGFSEG
jgi:hypothetical protein